LDEEFEKQLQDKERKERDKVIEKPNMAIYEHKLRDEFGYTMKYMNSRQLDLKREN
jgi:hypothetical protein